MTSDELVSKLVYVGTVAFPDAKGIRIDKLNFERGEWFGEISIIDSESFTKLDQGGRDDQFNKHLGDLKLMAGTLHIFLKQGTGKIVNQVGDSSILDELVLSPQALEDMLRVRLQIFQRPETQHDVRISLVVGLDPIIVYAAARVLGNGTEMRVVVKGNHPPQLRSKDLPIIPSFQHVLIVGKDLAEYEVCRTAVVDAVRTTLQSVRFVYLEL